MNYILALDNGTQSTRALLFDLRGELVAKSRVVVEPYFSERAGWAEQHADYFWESICQACQQLWQQTDIPKEAIAGVTVTTQRGTVVNVNRQGEALRPAIIWLDQRRTEGLPPLTWYWRWLFKLGRVDDMVAYLRKEAEANWIAQHQPETWAKTHKYLLLSGYLTYKLTGRFADSVGCQVGFLPFDSKRLRWAEPRNWRWEALSIDDTSMMPELVPVGGTIGRVTKAAAEATGIPEGMPLVAAAADKACEVLGSGVHEPEIGCLSYGTTATINITSQRYFEIIPRLPPYPAALPQTYNVEVQIYRGYWMVEWFKQEFGHPEIAIADERGIKPESLFDQMVQEVPPGSMGLMLQPYWTPGIRQPGPEAKGAVIGFGDVHTRAHLYRAILEGLAYALREGLERIERRGGIKVSELRISGGGSQSSAAMQLTADVFNLPVSRPHTYETSGLGAAVDAAVGLGLHPNFDIAIDQMTRIGDVFQPNPETHHIYDELYQRVYKQMYDRLKPLYQSIADITGYGG